MGSIAFPNGKNRTDLAHYRGSVGSSITVARDILEEG